MATIAGPTCKNIILTNEPTTTLAAGATVTTLTKAVIHGPDDDGSYHLSQVRR